MSEDRNREPLESEALNRTLFDAIDQSCCLFEKVRTAEGEASDFRYLMASPAFTQRSGLHDVVGKTIRELISGTDTGIIDVYDEVVRTGRTRCVVSYSPTRGHWLERKICPTLVPGQIAVLFNNITDSKRAAEALRASNRRINEILESIRDDFYVVDRDWNFVYANKNFTSRMRKDVKEFIGNNIWELFPDYLGTVLEENYRAAMEKRETREFELYGLYTCDWYRKKVYPSDEGITVLGIEITDRKKTEEALRESEQRAVSLVRELEKADKNKSDFISMLSHELRNPLTSITAGLSLLELSDSKENETKVREMIKRQVFQLSKLVEDLLDITRITQNIIKIRKEKISLNDILKISAEDMAPEFKVKGVRLLTEIPESPVMIDADPVRMTQCIGNVLHNALKFTQESGSVWVTLTKEKNEAVIRIRDNGIGISAEMLSSLFKPFYQADISLDRQNNGGLGLGLSIVKGIIELHDGVVNAHSDGLEKGTLFEIRLPVPGVQKERDDPGPADEAKGSRRILIIEDNKELTNIWCQIFGILGHEAFAAYDGTEGLARAKEIEPDIIFCDIGLPGKNGYEIAELIKEDPKLKKSFLIAMTGYAGEYDVEKAKKSGFDRHLAKPVDMEAIKKLLAEF